MTKVQTYLTHHNYLFRIINNIFLLYLPGIAQTIVLLTIPAPPGILTTSSTISVLSSPQVPQSQPPAEILLEELAPLVQQPPIDMRPVSIEQKLIQQPSDTKSSFHISGSGSVRLA